MILVTIAMIVSWRDIARSVLISNRTQQIYYVKAVPDAPPKGLDLNRAEDEQYPPEKLRMTLERFYMTVVVGLSGFFNHIARLRSWKEPIRTSIFCTVCSIRSLGMV